MTYTRCTAWSHAHTTLYSLYYKRTCLKLHPAYQCSTTNVLIMASFHSHLATTHTAIVPTGPIKHLTEYILADSNGNLHQRIAYISL